MSHAVWQVIDIFNVSIVPLDLDSPAGYSFFIILFGCFSFYSHIILSVYFWYSSGLSIRSISIAITQIKYFLDFFSSFFSVAFFILSLSSYIILQALSSLKLGAWSLELAACSLQLAAWCLRLISFRNFSQLATYAGLRSRLSCIK